MREGLKISSKVIVEHFDRKGKLIHRGVTHNLITNDGLDWLCGIMGDAAGNPALYMGLTADNTAPDPTDSALTGEYATDGLERAAATYAHTPGTAVYTLTKSFTNTGAVSHDVKKAGLFVGAVGGNLLGEALLDVPKTVAVGESINVTWERTLSNV